MNKTPPPTGPAGHAPAASAPPAPPVARAAHAEPVAPAKRAVVARLTVPDATSDATSGATSPAAGHATSDVTSPAASLGASSTASFYAADTMRPQQSIGWLMKRGLQSILLQADRALVQHDLTHAQWLPLYRIGQKALDNDACTVAALAREQAQDPGAMTRALDRLEAKGLVRRTRSDSDRRVVQLHLTDAGRAVADRVPPVLAQVLNEHLAGFSTDDFQQLLTLLQRVVATGDALRDAREAPDSRDTRNGPDTRNTPDTRDGRVHRGAR